MSRSDVPVACDGMGRPDLHLIRSGVGVAGTPSDARIRVLVVDDHPMIRDVIRVVCTGSQRVEVVGEASDADSALREAERLSPDVVVLDQSLPGLDGIEVAARLKAALSDVRILLLADDADAQTVFECRRLGVEGIFDKADSVEGMVSAIEAVGEGTRIFTMEQERDAHDQLASMVRRVRHEHRVATSVTPRELDVLRCIAEGFTTRQTATRLGLSERTVESHIAKLYTKLGARTRIQAAIQATKLGLLEETG